MKSGVDVLLTRLQVPLVALVLTHLFGTVGFYVVWRDVDGTWFDALFMTFITITTIGFGEIHPLGSGGRILTMLVALSGIGSLFYSFTVLLEWATSDQARAERRRRKMQKDIDQLTGHYIVAGLGRVGREAVKELIDSKVAFVAIDPSEAGARYCQESGTLHLRGDATEDAMLVRAGVKRAKGLVITTADDATNLYVAMSARLLNAELFIAARAADEHSVPKLIRAGANRAISPYAIGGRRLAHLMLSPRIVDFFETALKRGHSELNITEIAVGATSPSTGQTLEAMQVASRTGATILAVLRDGAPIPNPKGDTALAGGDHLLVLGTDEQLQKAEAMFSGA